MEKAISNVSPTISLGLVAGAPGVGCGGQQGHLARVSNLRGPQILTSVQWQICTREQVRPQHKCWLFPP